MSQYVVYRGVYCQVFEHGWRVKEWRSPQTGQLELMAWKKRCYEPLRDLDGLECVAAPEVDQSDTLLGQQREAERKKRAAEKSAARAKRTCRHRIKSAGASSLLTCTYRENMTDFDRARRDWAAYLRKLRRAIPGFRAVYAFEQQDRGAWHVHAAIDRLPKHLDTVDGRVRSWDFLRRLWHSVVGKDNGNIDVDGHLKTRHGLPGKFRAAESLAKLAGYVSKYLTKDHENGIPGRNRWGSTQGIEVSKPVVIDLPEMPLAELVGVAFEVPDGHRIVRHGIGKFGKFWMLYTEPGEADFSGQEAQEI